MSSVFDTFGEFDPNDLVGTGLVSESDDEHESDALQQVAQRISGQYGEVIATWSARMLASAEPARTEGMAASVENLRRLAVSARDARKLSLLVDLSDLLVQLEGTRPRTRRGDQARVALRDWIPAFAATLTGEDSERLMGIVRWDDDSVPLLEELKEIHGIGPRRLTRLYSAGLGDIDAIANASPEDVAAVTGIPLGIATEVVTRSQEFAKTERQRCIREIRNRATRLQALLGTMSDDSSTDLKAAAREALVSVEAAFQSLLDSPLENA